MSRISVLAEAEGLNRWGVNACSQGLFPSVIRPVIKRADTMEEVMPHFWKPVATYQSGVEAEYRPI